MNALGDYFREQREEQGYSVEEVARRTNIGSRYIRAIEDEDFEQFPADVYAKGFIRTYARFLDLDAEALVVEYGLNFEEDEDVETSETRRSRVYYWLTLAGLGALAVVIVVFRFAWITPETARTQLRSEPERNVVAPASDNSPTRLSVEESADELVLEIVATQKTLVYAEFDGMEKREFVMLPGERTTWRAEEVIRLRTGNPGGLKLYVRGMKLPALGRSGEVIDKIIQLKDEELEIRPVRFRSTSNTAAGDTGTDS
jgi:cytoskeleton protein RodZ